AVALHQRGAAADRAAQAESRRFAAESLVATETDHLASMRAAVAAWRQAPTPEARGALLSAQTLDSVGELGTGPGGWSVALSPDGGLAAVGHADGTVRLWDTATLRRVGGDLRHSRKQYVTSVRFSPDGRYLASGSLERDGVKIWAVPSGRPLHTVPAAGAVAWRTDSRAVLATQAMVGPLGARLGAWDPATGRRVGDIVIGRRISLARALAVSPDNAYVAEITGAAQEARVWRLAGGAPVATAPGAMYLAFGPDNMLLTSGTDGVIRRWELPSGRELRSVTTAEDRRDQSPLAVTPAGAVLADGDESGEVDSWNVRSTVALQPLLGIGGAMADIAVSADGGVVAVTGLGAPTLLLRGPAGRLGHPRLVTAVAWHPDGERLASASTDGAGRIWDLASRSAAATLRHPARPTSAAYAPDGTVATTDEAGTVRLWDAAGRQRAAVRLGTGVEAANATYAADGSVLAVSTQPPTPTATVAAGKLGRPGCTCSTRARCASAASSPCNPGTRPGWR
ncbi:MAG TPA: hypothetical protein VES42_15535, partial [Pilimelia sp.]|nr:hypothetical protein [Pilimelia sp.]